MQGAVPLTDQIFWTGVNDRETRLFEELWPMPRGISYNSFLVIDKKVALIDAVKAMYSADLVRIIKDCLGFRKVDYLIINHIEPDHSGAITILRDIYPDMKIIGNVKTLEYLSDLYGIREKVRAIEDGEVLDLGRHRLKFFITPMVHWPETMMTYEESERILFSGDVFGGFGMVDGGLFDDETDAGEWYEEEALRYFSNVIGKYSAMVQKALTRIQEVDLRITAPTHGLLWRGSPRRIVDLYDRWSRYEMETSAVIVYASMYGNTERMADAISRALTKEGIHSVKVHNVSRSHVSYIIGDVWRARAVIVGSPTYNMQLFPLIESCLSLLQNKGIKNRITGIFGSYGWAGGGMQQLREFAAKMSWDVVKPEVTVKGAPTDETLNQCSLLGMNITRRLLGESE